jgi:hypothetical protein
MTFTEAEETRAQAPSVSAQQILLDDLGKDIGGNLNMLKRGGHPSSTYSVCLWHREGRWAGRVREMGAVAVIGLGARVSREEIGDDG